jgi:multidrug resistance efflux pump
MTRDGTDLCARRRLPAGGGGRGGWVFAIFGATLAALVAVSAADAQPKAEGQIGATGYIAPANGVILLRGPTGAVIGAIYVHVGDHLKKGDPLIAFDDTAPKGEEKVAALELDTAIKMAAQREAVEAQTLRRAEQKLQRAQKEAASYRAVGVGGTSYKEISQLVDDVEEAQFAVDVEKAKQQEAVVETANAVSAAAARLEVAKAKVASYVLRAPSDGTVLQIERSVGDTAGSEPLMQFADLSTMFVICQVYEGDMLKLKRGMKATITTAGIPDLGTGAVEQVGQLIDGRSQLGEVRLRLDRNSPADRLVGMSVEVLIAP